MSKQLAGAAIAALAVASVVGCQQGGTGSAACTIQVMNTETTSAAYVTANVSGAECDALANSFSTYSQSAIEVSTPVGQQACTGQWSWPGSGNVAIQVYAADGGGEASSICDIATLG